MEKFSEKSYVLRDEAHPPTRPLVVSTVGHRVGIRGKDWPNLSLQFKHLLLSEVTLSLL